MYRCGNHEQRLSVYLAAKAPELLATKRIRDKLTLPVFLNLEERKVHWVKNMDPIAVGKLRDFTRP